MTGGKRYGSVPKLKRPAPATPYRIPPAPAPSLEQLESEANLFGRGWTDSALCLPWADCRGTRRFAVLSPSYGGEVFICRFWSDGEGGGRWWHEPLQVGVSGVTHWRLAGDDEQEYRLARPRWPTPGAMGISLSAQRWHWLHINGPFEVFDPLAPRGYGRDFW